MFPLIPHAPRPSPLPEVLGSRGFYLEPELPHAMRCLSLLWCWAAASAGSEPPTPAPLTHTPTMTPPAGPAGAPVAPIFHVHAGHAGMMNDPDVSAPSPLPPPAG